MTSTNRRTFLALGAGGLAATAVASCSADSPEEPTETSKGGDRVTAQGGRATGSFTDMVMADKPLVYVAMQEDADATEPRDDSGHDRTLVWHGAKWWPNDGLGLAAPNAVGRAWYTGLAGDEAWIELPEAAKDLANLTSKGVTVQMWVCQEEANFNQRLLDLVSTEEAGGWSFGFKSGGKGLVAEGPGYKVVEMPGPDIVGGWHHVAITMTPDGTATGFVDGKKVGGGNVGAFKGSLKAATLASKEGRGAYISGLWSQLAVHAGALGEDRIAALYQAGTAATDPAVRGVDHWFGGVEYYAKFKGAEVLTDPKRFPVAEWWMDCFPEEFAQEKKYADGAVVLDPKAAPEGPRQAGIWVVRMKGMDMTGTPGAETIGWMPQDEPDMDPKKAEELVENLAAIPDDQFTYTNYGIGVTISSIDRFQVREMVERPDLHQVSADLYSYCVNPKVIDDVVKAWGCKPEHVRRAAAHGIVVDRCRAFLKTPKPVWGVIATGHSNNTAEDQDGWTSVPSADEVEGSMMSCITHGASGILLFPQAFPDGKKAPKWEAGKDYQPGDTVHDPKDEYLFWWARTKPAKGVEPASVTDDSWLSWRPNPHGLRQKDHYARGVSDRVAQVKERLQRHAEAFNSRSHRKLVNDKLTARYWPKAPDGMSYLLVMQQLAFDKGDYEIVLPDGAQPAEVELVDGDRTIAVDGGRFTETFEHEWEHRLYRWKA